MAHKPVGTGFTVTSTGSAVKSSSFVHKTDTLRVVTFGARGHIAIGTEPTATHVDYFLTANNPETVSLGAPRSQRVVGVTTGETTTIIFEEGLTSQFGVGDYVSLVVSEQSYYDFTHQPVISVNTSSGYNGYFSTRIGIGTNTSGIVTSFNSPYAELRNSLKVSFISDGGTGNMFAQQVQITGQA